MFLAVNFPNSMAEFSIRIFASTKKSFKIFRKKPQSLSNVNQIKIILNWRTKHSIFAQRYYISAAKHTKY